MDERERGTTKYATPFWLEVSEETMTPVRPPATRRPFYNVRLL